MAEQVRHPEFAARMVQAAEAIGGAMTHRGRNAEFARRISKISQHHVSADTARRWFEGFALPRYNRYPEIAEALGVNLEWLETGKGDMFPPERPEAPEGAATETQQPTIQPATAPSENNLGAIAERLERASTAATYVAAAMRLRGISADASGSVITVRVGSSAFYAVVGVAGAGDHVTIPRRDGMMTIIAVLGLGDETPAFAVVPAGPVSPEDVFHVSPTATDIAGPDGKRYPVTRSLSHIMAAA